MLEIESLAVPSARAVDRYSAGLAPPKLWKYMLPPLALHYDSIKQFWVHRYHLFFRPSYGGPLPSPPTYWEPIETRLERFNQASERFHQASILTPEERSCFDRCSYFKPISAPVWEFEKALFSLPAAS
ncbi:hypothetical protein PtrM4_033150 [Pyrenophora tritici-repentis]|uniref:Uncharacterized protein n=1 Tax=Pyrenophora tritici-repentis TaxID=45151 RepID=A0A834SAY5_9PLEO|nr:hypothetical protein PtrM4_033150 [Pyrenophora tritici-repentis]